MNYTPAEPLPSELCLQRLQQWMMLTLVRFAVHLLAVIAPDVAARCIAEMRGRLCTVMLVRAFRLVREPRPLGRADCDDRAWTLRDLRVRGMAGFVFMRALAGRGALEQSRALYAVLADADRWVAHLARRIARGFTKLRQPRHRSLRAPPPTPAHALPRCTDSS